jgi:hypothetical protein
MMDVPPMQVAEVVIERRFEGDGNREENRGLSPNSKQIRFKDNLKSGPVSDNGNNWGQAPIDRLVSQLAARHVRKQS